MPRSLPKKDKTVKIRSNVNVAGFRHGQIAEVDFNQKTRDLIAGGLWTLLVSPAEQEAISAPEPEPVTVVEEDLPEEI